MYKWGFFKQNNICVCIYIYIHMITYVSNITSYYMCSVRYCSMVITLLIVIPKQIELCLQDGIDDI